MIYKWYLIGFICFQESFAELPENCVRIIGSLNFDTLDQCMVERKRVVSELLDLPEKKVELDLSCVDSYILALDPYI